MLSGRHAFPPGETASDTLAGVLAREPDWTQLPAATPARVRALIERCLRKDRRQRLRDIGDALPDLQDLPADAAPSTALASGPWRRRELVWATVAVAALTTAAVVAVVMRRQPDTRVVAFSVEAPQRGFLDVGQPLSPDGRQLAFVAASSSGARVIWVRSIDSPTAQPIEGTENASDVFWSPDSQQLGFFADGRLKRVPAAGGAAQVITTIMGRTFGATWSAHGVILFAILDGDGLFRVSAAGGQPTRVTSLDTSAGDQRHTAPEFLPDGRRFLFNVVSGGFVRSQAYVGSLDSPDRQALIGIPSPARYAPTGHILFTSGGALMAQTFDVDTLELSGEPFEVAKRVGGANGNPFSVSANGSLAYSPVPDTETELKWFDRAGTFLGLAAPRNGYLNPELSPDDQRIAVDIRIQNNVDVWTLDVSRRQRLTTHEAADFTPVWSPDGTVLGFTSYRGGLGRLYRRAVEAVADEGTLVLETTTEQRLSDWSRDGRYLLFVQEEPATGDRPPHEDIYAISLDNAEPIRVTDTVSGEGNPRFSPDGRWIAYVSDVSGQSEVYVQSFPRRGPQQQVSAGDGRSPRWNDDGTEIYYVTTDGTVMAVSFMSSGDTARIGIPTRLFQTAVEFTGIDRILNVSKDGRFLLNVVPDDRAAPSIVVVHNWAARLAK
jgi:Tol biopolymer transport system component